MNSHEEKKQAVKDRKAAMNEPKLEIEIVEAPDQILSGEGKIATFYRGPAGDLLGVPERHELSDGDLLCVEMKGERHRLVIPARFKGPLRKHLNEGMVERWVVRVSSASGEEAWREFTSEKRAHDYHMKITNYGKWAGEGGLRRILVPAEPTT